jgi:hypothetical protein
MMQPVEDEMLRRMTSAPGGRELNATDRQQITAEIARQLHRGGMPQAKANQFAPQVAAKIGADFGQKFATAKEQANTPQDALLMLLQQQQQKLVHHDAQNARLANQIRHLYGQQNRHQVQQPTVLPFSNF